MRRLGKVRPGDLAAMVAVSVMLVPTQAWASSVREINGVAVQDVSGIAREVFGGKILLIPALVSQVAVWIFIGIAAIIALTFMWSKGDDHKVWILKAVVSICGVLGIFTLGSMFTGGGAVL